MKLSLQDVPLKNIQEFKKKGTQNEQGKESEDAMKCEVYSTVI